MDGAWTIPDTADSPQDHVDRDEAIEYAMAMLPECHRRVLEVVAANGRTEAARQFDVSRRQIANIMIEIRERFEAAGL